MATSPRRSRFARRMPDHVSDELVNVLTTNKSELYFNDLFALVYEGLKTKNAVSGGEEMLRLRTWEKLQGLVGRGVVSKNGKSYRGLDRLHELMAPASTTIKQS